MAGYYAYGAYIVILYPNKCVDYINKYVIFLYNLYIFVILYPNKNV